MKKEIVVVAAICFNQEAKEILAAQRPTGDFAGKWEFPGGKIEQGETNAQALQREMKEELNAKVSVGGLFYTVDHEYPKFHLTMYCYVCELESDIELLEHLDAQWVSSQEIDSLEWLPADIPVVEKIKEKLLS